ncbi:MAG: hypothetical protein ACK5JT_08195 [Hyphomicrobiaceae bacterium]
MCAGDELPAYSVDAYNVSHASENKIHDDTVAQKLGFSGGLVPGVEVFAYASHLPVAHWGRAFLECGSMTARFGKPVYDGRVATAVGRVVPDGLALEVTSEGVSCATGHAALREGVGTVPDLAGYRTPAPPAERPPADETSLAEARELATTPDVLTPERHADYLRDVRETDPLYGAEGIAHPGILLRLCNSLLRENVVLPPGIQVGSPIDYFRVARVGEALSARARVSAHYEKKGRRFVDLASILVADDAHVSAPVNLTAIYRLRHLPA